ncbi:MAG: cytochrome c oxidase assembly protein [Gammaproteobacteria bacterium]|nr:cytochrome c oxidase assembly protein [Gammaproteobacteria bacterium]
MTNVNVQQAARKTVTRLLLVAVAMFGFGYLLVPLYSVICDITGLNGNTSGLNEARAQSVDAAQGQVGREVQVKFTANVANSAPIDFAPEETTVTVKLGEPRSTLFRAKNRSGRDLIAQASPSVSPAAASLYFSKTECFCFTRQPFKIDEEKEMPVRFVIDPKLPANIDTVILSYTFFDITEKR